MSSHGQITGFFVGPDDYGEFKRFRDQRRAFLTEELSDEEIRAIAASRMEPRHSHRDDLLDQK